MRCELVARFDYGSIVPWVTRHDDNCLRLVAGPDRLMLDTKVALRGEGMTHRRRFRAWRGRGGQLRPDLERVLRAGSPKLDAAATLADIEKFWSDWTKPFKAPRQWAEAVLRSLLTLKALTHWQTGGIVAAATTSLPEKLGGRAQLGLSLLLAARRDFHALCADRRGLSRGSARLARLAPARRRRQARRAADHVWPCAASGG